MKVKRSVYVFMALFLVFPFAVYGEGLRLVDEVSHVCMVNDRYTGSPQIPVDVDGRRYYGCCQGCVRRLESDVRVRISIDPVTRRIVDKADSIIAVDKDGRVYYFESMDSFERFSTKGGNGDAY